MIWIKWSWRDLRSRWMQVAAIAIVIAFGTGLFSGLRSMNEWRAMSNEASYAAVNTFDLRVTLGTGGFVDRGTLLDAVAEVASSYVTDVEERLIVPTQVSVETAEGTVIVPGRLIGVDVEGDGPHVNSLHAAAGRALTEADAGLDVVALERNFAKFYDLPDSGKLTLTGNVPVEYVGHVLYPDYFIVMTPEGGMLAQANFAAVFASLETAERLAGVEGKVNDLVLTVSTSADEDALVRAFESRFEEMGGAVSRRLDDPSIRVVIEDVEGDRQFNTVLAIAILGGAIFAAFNLSSRIVDSQRREIGINMALGVPPLMVALRPLLIGAQVALLGVVFGIGMGIGLAQLLRGVLMDTIPLPIWETPFQFDVFAAAALLGFVVPFLATAIPVWRSVRVPPIDAIKTGHLAARSGGLAWLLKKVRIPGQTARQIPFRNVARAPRRTLLTALGISAIVTILVLMMGMFDSFLGVFEKGEIEAAGDHPDRVGISLDSFYMLDSPTVKDIVASEVTADAEAGLRLGGTVSNGAESFDVFLQFIDFQSPLWRPTITEGSLDGPAGGVLISEKAAGDLGVEPGDSITLRHPVAGGPSLFTQQDSEVTVVGLHPDPFRFNVYMDVNDAGLVGIEGLTNVVNARPADGVELDTLKRTLFGLQGVGSVQKATAASDVIRDQFEQYTALLGVIQVAIIALALLIAYNTASINMDERRREHATMFAYGLPVRTVLGMAVVESAILGVIATALGLVGGYLFLQWVMLVLMPNVMPDLGAEIVIKPTSLITAVALGIGSVAIAPVLTVRRLRRMDVPSTLRVME